MNSASSCTLQQVVCIRSYGSPNASFGLWHVASQYLTTIHDSHVLRLMPTPSMPQSAQQAADADLAHPTGHVPPSSSVPFDQKYLSSSDSLKFVLVCKESLSRRIRRIWNHQRNIFVFVTVVLLHDGDNEGDYRRHGLLTCGVAVKAIPTTEFLQA